MCVYSFIFTHRFTSVIRSYTTTVQFHIYPLFHFCTQVVHYNCVVSYLPIVLLLYSGRTLQLCSFIFTYCFTFVLRSYTTTMQFHIYPLFYFCNQVVHYNCVVSYLPIVLHLYSGRTLQLCSFIFTHCFTSVIRSYTTTVQFHIYPLFHFCTQVVHYNCVVSYLPIVLLL